MKKDIKVEDIIEWIILNNEDRTAIDKINSTTFPFTSKYLGFTKNKEKQAKRGWKKASSPDDAF